MPPTMITDPGQSPLVARMQEDKNSSQPYRKQKKKPISSSSRCMLDKEYTGHLPSYKNFAHTAIDAGADIVIEHIRMGSDSRKI